MLGIIVGNIVRHVIATSFIHTAVWQPGAMAVFICILLTPPHLNLYCLGWWMSTECVLKFNNFNAEVLRLS